MDEVGKKEVSAEYRHDVHLNETTKPQPNFWRYIENSSDPLSFL